jgi:oligosaccharyltransferase complex subunit epsilon
MTTSLVRISRDVVRNYIDKTAVQVKVLDAFLVYTLFAGIVQFVYCALVGTFPFNSFLSGFLATVGVFVFTGMLTATAVRSCVTRLKHVSAVSLRFQVTQPSDFNGRTMHQAFGEYIIACVVLFLAVLNFIG